MSIMALAPIPSALQTNCVGQRVTVDFGREPLGSPDGRELFYRNGNQVWEREIANPSTMTFGESRMLFDGPFRYPESEFRSYDLHPDGGRFLMISDPTNDEIRIVQNYSHPEHPVPRGRSDRVWNHRRHLAGRTGGPGDAQ